MDEHKIVDSYRNRAKEDLEAARQMIATRLYLAAISRSYYAVFYAITALLLERGIEVHRHKQLGIEFRKCFVKSGLLPTKYSELLDELFEARQSADYDAIPDISEERAKELVHIAEEFVQTLLAFNPK